MGEGGEEERGGNCGISFYFFECYCTIRVLFEEFRSIRSRIRKRQGEQQHPKADRINSSRGIGLAVENAERLSRSRQQRSLSATFGAPWSAVEKYMCNRSTASLVYACHANAYARHVRFPGVTAPSLVVIRVPRLLPALVRPINAKKKKITYRLPIEPLNRWYHDRIQTA